MALISACLPTLRPLLSAFLQLIGLQNSNHTGGSSERDQSKSGPSKVKSVRKKTPTTGTSEFSVLEEGRDGWSTEDEVPLHNIQVRKEYSQHNVNVDDKDLARMSEHTRRMWYPGGGKPQV